MYQNPNHRLLHQTCIVTGANSGIGKDVALAMGRDLWYNALKIYLFLAKEIGLSGGEDLSEVYVQIAGKLKKNFRAYFFNKAGYLNDVVIPGKSADDALRPNQVYVVSQPFSLLNRTDERKVLHAVEKHLYTPFGLRTLSPEHPDFKPVYGGTPWSRDTAYHQGTVWPFLLGDYFLAMLKVKGDTPKLRQEIVQSLETLRAHFYQDDCIHGLSEIFDGLAPGEGRGTVQQAWSVGALLHILLKISS